MSHRCYCRVFLPRPQLRTSSLYKRSLPKQNIIVSKALTAATRRRTYGDRPNIGFLRAVKVPPGRGVRFCKNRRYHHDVFRRR
ncbi:hypothetical protein [Choristoneura diversana nucleopolyhedrovirus]|nr:hypothetical protein [Choristoneura diversana nucleopolyhedrovirus]